MVKSNSWCVFWISVLLFSHTFYAQMQPITYPTNMIHSLKTPPYLKPGDTIAIVAPAGIVKDTMAVKKAVALVKSWGLQVLVGDRVFEDNYHFAGTDVQRANDFQQALDNKNVKAIWAARGGYGTVRIIDKLDFTEFKKHPKWIVGYSDITVLHSHLHNLGFETIHALMPMSMKAEEAARENSVTTFKKALFEESLHYTIPTSKYNKNGIATGQLVGGNLAILQSLLGSTSAISTENKILFIEDVGEYLYSIDRMLQALKRSGYFENCKGLLVGDFSDIKENTTPYGKPLEALILDVIKDYDFPVIFDFPAGHENDNRALFLGRNVQINANKNETTVIF